MVELAARKLVDAIGGPPKFGAALNSEVGEPAEAAAANKFPPRPLTGREKSLIARRCFQRHSRITTDPVSMRHLSSAPNPVPTVLPIPELSITFRLMVAPP